MGITTFSLPWGNALKKTASRGIWAEIFQTRALHRAVCMHVATRLVRAGRALANQLQAHGGKAMCPSNRYFFIMALGSLASGTMSEREWLCKPFAQGNFRRQSQSFRTYRRLASQCWTLKSETRSFQPNGNVSERSGFLTQACGAVRHVFQSKASGLRTGQLSQNTKHLLRAYPRKTPETAC